MAVSNIEIEEVDDWTNLRFTINKYFAHWPSYIFRGQAQDDWLLEPTLSRALKTLNPRDWEKTISNHLDVFKLEIRGRRGDNPKLLNENETWALGQHFGLFTPLLDWTESPWVAVYFALNSTVESKTGKCALWALCLDDIEPINSSHKEKNTKSALKM